MPRVVKRDIRICNFRGKHVLPIAWHEVHSNRATCIPWEIEILLREGCSGGSSLTRAMEPHCQRITFTSVLASPKPETTLIDDKGALQSWF